MQSFQVAVTNVLITLLYILPGFVLCKVRKASADHLSTMSAVLVYVLSPCMIINSFLQLEFSPQGIANMGMFFAVTFVLQIAFMLILFAVFHKKYADAKYRVCTIGSVMGNVGFFGLPIVQAILPDNPEVMCYSAVYVVSMNILVFTVGVFCLTQDKKFMSVKAALLNPSTISFVIALPLYCLGVGGYIHEPALAPYLEPLAGCLSLLGKMTTPLCMFILGIRLATVQFSKLFTRPFVYLTCALKLVVFPLFCYFAVYFIPFEQSFKASILILSAVPCASVILNMAEMHHAEEELAANSVLLSTLMCFITIPVLTLLL